VSHANRNDGRDEEQALDSSTGGELKEVKFGLAAVEKEKREGVDGAKEEEEGSRAKGGIDALFGIRKRRPALSV
jgi:hypothetical protein